MDQFLVLSNMSPVSNLDSIKLSGALLSTYFDMYPENSFKDFYYPKLQVTDPFPLISGKPLLPMPLVPELRYPAEANSKEKIKSMKERKVKHHFVTSDVAAGITARYAEAGYASAYIEDIFAGEEENISGLIPRVEEIPGVSLATVSMESTLYTKEIVRYPINAELWLHLSTDKDELLVAFAALQDRGISARRSSGLGKFKLRGAKFPIHPGYNAPGLYLLLAPFIPIEGDFKNVDLSRSSYQISHFSGIDKSGNALGFYRYFETGSVLFLKDSVKGKWIIPQTGRKRLLNFTGCFLRLGK